MRRKRRKPLEPFDPKYYLYLTSRELAWYLRTTLVTVKRWAGWIKSPWKVPSFPPYLYRIHDLAFEANEVENWTGIKIPNKRIIIPLMSLQDISALTGRHIDTVRDWVKSGKLKATRIGYKLWRIEQKELLCYLNETYDYMVIDRKAANSIGFDPREWY